MTRALITELNVQLREKDERIEELRAALEECVSAWDDYGTSSGIERVNRAIEKARTTLRGS